MIRRQSIIALAIAVALGLLAVYLANAYWSARDRTSAANEGGMIKVAVAAVPLDFGSPITPDKIRFAAYPARSLPPGTLPRPQPAFTRRQGPRRAAPDAGQPAAPVQRFDRRGPGRLDRRAAARRDARRLGPDQRRVGRRRLRPAQRHRRRAHHAPGDRRRARRAGDRRPAAECPRHGHRPAVGEQRRRREVAQARHARSDRRSTRRSSRWAQQVGALSLVLRKPGEEQNNPFVETVSLDDLRYGIYGPARAGPPLARRPPPVAAPRAVQAAYVRRPAQPAPRRAAVAAAPGTTTDRDLRGAPTSTITRWGHYGS